MVDPSDQGEMSGEVSETGPPPLPRPLPFFPKLEWATDIEPTPAGPTSSWPREITPDVSAEPPSTDFWASNEGTAPEPETGHAPRVFAEPDTDLPGGSWHGVEPPSPASFIETTSYELDPPIDTFGVEAGTGPVPTSATEPIKKEGTTEMNVEDYAKANFTGLKKSEAQELLNEHAEHAEQLARQAKAKRMDLRAARSEGSLSAVELDDLSDEIETLKEQADFFKAVVDYVHDNARSLGYPKIGYKEHGVFNGLKHPDAQDKSSGRSGRVLGFAKRHPIITGVTGVALSFFTYKAVTTDNPVGRTVQSCAMTDDQAREIGEQTFTKLGELDPAMAASTQSISMKALAANCSPDESAQLISSGQQGVEDAFAQRGANVPTTLAPRTTAPEQGQENGTTTTLGEPTETTVAGSGIDDRITCSPEGEIVAVEPGSAPSGDSIQEDYPGDSCVYPGAGQQVQRTEPGGGTDLVIGL